MHKMENNKKINIFGENDEVSFTPVEENERGYLNYVVFYHLKGCGVALKVIVSVSIDHTNY